jgi:hypothetical protein
VSSGGLHPVLVSVHEIDGNFGLHFVDNHLDAASRLERPVEELIEPVLAAFALLDDVLHVLLPDNLLFFR